MAPDVDIYLKNAGGITKVGWSSEFPCVIVHSLCEQRLKHFTLSLLCTLSRPVPEYLHSTLFCWIAVALVNMRILAVLPALMCTAALVLSFLCLFAGSKRNFMESYAILTVGFVTQT